MNKGIITQLAIAGIVAGGLSLAACDNGTSGKDGDNAAGIMGAKTLADFQSECAKLGGAFAAHDCQGLNECKGHSFSDDKGIAKHDCKGTSTCKGGSCIES